ncbi:hypothetical protein ACFL4P_01055 [Gemmatimonadota bacterium]
MQKKQLIEKEKDKNNDHGKPREKHGKPRSADAAVSRQLVMSIKERILSEKQPVIGMLNANTEMR